MHRKGEDLGLLVLVMGEAHLLEIENDVGNVLDHAGKRRELVGRSGDLDRCDGRALETGEKDPAKRVAQGMAVAAVEGFRDELRVGVGGGVLVLDEAIGHLEWC